MIRIQGLINDLLKEIGNIGAGRAAVSLSKFLHQEVSMSLPYMSEVDNMDELLGIVKNTFDLTEEDFSMVYTTINDSEEYLLFSLMSRSSCEELIRLSFDNLAENNETTQALIDSLLLEVGNILLITYIDALNKFINLDLMAKPGKLATGTLEELIDTYKAYLDETEKYQNSDFSSYVLIDLSIFTVTEKITAYLGLIPSKQTIEEIKKSMIR